MNVVKGGICQWVRRSRCKSGRLVSPLVQLIEDSLVGYHALDVKSAVCHVFAGVRAADSFFMVPCPVLARFENRALAERE